MSVLAFQVDQTLNSVSATCPVSLALAARDDAVTIRVLTNTAVEERTRGSDEHDVGNTSRVIPGRVT